MFRCQLCQCVVPHTPCQRLVLIRRNKKYPYRSRANVVTRQRANDKKPKREYRDDPAGEGQEIVREVIVCPDCAARNGQRCRSLATARDSPISLQSSRRYNEVLDRGTCVCLRCIMEQAARSRSRWLEPTQAGEPLM